MSPIFDTHAHLSNNTSLISFDQAQINSNIFLNVTTQSNEWLPSIDFTQNKPNILNSLGLHPWFVGKDWSLQLTYMERLLAENKLDSIGEIGLDYYPQYVLHKNRQLQAFTKQINIAITHELPVSIHCRKAFDDLFQIVKPAGLKGVLHGFSSSYQLAERFIKIGLSIGIGGLILNNQSKRITQLVEQIPINKIVLETDYPNFKAGTTLLGLSDSHLIIERISQIKGISQLEVSETLYNNASKIFGNKK